MNYRALDPVQDWDFFMADCPVPADCLPLIHPLTEESACGLWREFVSPAFVSPAQLPAEAWPTRVLSSAVSHEWHADWNDDTSTAFVGWLRSVLPWTDAAPVFFTRSDSESTETTWEVSCRCWRCFLFCDEGPILWSLQQPQVVRFLPSGFAYVGERTSPLIAA